MQLLSSIASASSSCIEWVQLSEGEAIPSNLLVSGANQGPHKSPQAFCRYAALDYSPMELTIGKFTVPKSKAWSSSPCFFTGSAAAGASVVQNGTISGGYELATIPAGNSCNVSFVETQVAAPAPPLIAGFNSDGSRLGLCLALGGEGGPNSRIPGKYFMDGPRAGQCSYSSGFQEHLSTTFVIAVTHRPPTPEPRPPVPAEPTPPNLASGGVFSAMLSYGASSATMGLTFATHANATSASYAPIVLWRPAATPSAPESKASCSSSLARKNCRTNAAAPTHRYCNMTGLAPRTVYSYRFGDETVGLSEPRTFESAPRVGDLDATVVAVAYGDMGLDYSENTRARLAHDAATAQRGDPNFYDFIIHNGDVSYADNRPHAQYNSWMNLFYANVSRYGSKKPYMLGPGNHEAPCDYAEYDIRNAHMPHYASKSNDVEYYSYTVGGLHVVSLSGEKNRLGGNKTAEMTWLMADLKEASEAKGRGEISWIITHVHYPANPGGYCTSMMTYCCADGRKGLRTELEGSERWAALGATTPPTGAPQSCVEDFQTPLNRWVEDKFVEYGVDVHLTAHQHVYERTTPVYRYTAFGNGSDAFPEGNDGSLFVAPKYPININNGCPGNAELQDVWMPRPSWSVGLRTNTDGSGGTGAANAYRDFGVLRMHASKASLRIEYVDSKNGTTVDEFTIVKKA